MVKTSFLIKNNRIDLNGFVERFLVISMQLSIAGKQIGIYEYAESEIKINNNF